MKILFTFRFAVLGSFLCSAIPVGAQSPLEIRSLEEARQVVIEANAVANAKPQALRQMLLYDVYRAYLAVNDFENAAQAALTGSEQNRLRNLEWIVREAVQKRGVQYAQTLLGGWNLEAMARDRLTTTLASYAARSLDFEEGLKIIPDASRRFYLTEQFGAALRAKDFAKAKRILMLMNDGEQVRNSIHLAKAMADAGFVDDALGEISALRDVEFHGVAAWIGEQALARKNLELAGRMARLMLDPPTGIPGVELSGRASSWGMLGGCPGYWREEWVEKGSGPGIMYPIADCRFAPSIAALNFAVALHKAGEFDLAKQIVDRFRRYAMTLAERLPGLAKEEYRLVDFTLGPPGAYLTRTLAALAATENITSAQLLAEAMFVTRYWIMPNIAESLGEAGDAELLAHVLNLHSKGAPDKGSLDFGLYGLLKSGHLESGWRWAAQYQKKLSNHLSLSAAYFLFRDGQHDKASALLDFVELNEHLFDSVRWAAVGDGRKQMNATEGALRAYRRAFAEIANSAGDRPEYNGWSAAYLVWQLNSLGESLSFEAAAALLPNAATRQRFLAVVAELELINGRFAEAELYRSKLFDNRESVAVPPNAPALIAFDARKVEELARRGYLADALRQNLKNGEEYGRVAWISQVVDFWSRWHYQQNNPTRPN